MTIPINAWNILKHSKHGENKRMDCLDDLDVHQVETIQPSSWLSHLLPSPQDPEPNWRLVIGLYHGFTIVLPKCQSCSKRKHDISLHSLHKSNANLWKNPCQSGDRPGNWHCFLPITAATRFSKQVDDGWHLRQRPQDRWRGTQQLKNISLKGKTQSPKCHCLNMFETSFSPWSPLH